MSRQTGAHFERVAEAFLTRRGLRTVETNYSCRGGEIDIICDDRGTLVFVEVRARKGHGFGAPEETVGLVKRQRLILAARHYLMRKGLEDRNCRFDVVAIEGTEVRHFENAFELS